MSSECECSADINCLQKLKTSFSNKSFIDKQKVIEAGRPTPNLKLCQQQKKTMRYFNIKFYDNYKWVCGCTHDDKMYC